MQALRPDDREAAVRISQNEDRIWLDFCHELIGRGDDIPHRFSQILADGIQVNLRICQSQIVEEYAIQVVVIVLPRVRQQGVEIGAAFLDDRSLVSCM